MVRIHSPRPFLSITSRSDLSSGFCLTAKLKAKGSDLAHLVRGTAERVGTVPQGDLRWSTRLTGTLRGSEPPVQKGPEAFEPPRPQVSGPL